VGGQRGWRLSEGGAGEGGATEGNHPYNADHRLPTQSKAEGADRRKQSQNEAPVARSDSQRKTTTRETRDTDVSAPKNSKDKLGKQEEKASFEQVGRECA